MRDVISALHERAEAFPDEVFCRLLAEGRESVFSNARALEASRRWARLFRSRNVAPGAPVVIILRHASDLYFAFLGAMLAGCAPSFMPSPSSKQDPELYWSQHQAVFARIGVAAVVTYPENLAPLAAHCPGLTVFTAQDLGDGPCEPDRPAVRGEDIAFLQHSSGTTGLKKGVLLSYGAVAGQVERYAQALRLERGDVVVSWLPLYHDMGLVACFMLPLTLGLPIVSLDPFEWAARPQILFEAIQAHGGTHVWLPNFAFHHLCRTVAPEFSADLSGVKAFIDCSEPCRIETLELFAQSFARLGVRPDQCRICYAMAETVFAVTQTPADGTVAALEHEGRKIPSVGRPIRDVQLRVLGTSGDALPDGQAGEVCVRAPFLFSGYHRDPELTARKLQDGWYSTGDLGLLRDGELYLLGRTDDLIILNGRNVLAHDVEFAINAQVPQVKPGRCIALGVFEAEVGSQELVVLAEAAPGPDPRGLARQIRAAVFNELGLMPKTVQAVPPGWLVKTTSGKLARRLNLGKYLAQKAKEPTPAP